MMNLENTRPDGDGLAGKPGWKALATGAVGAATVTLAHDVVRKLVPHPPRMDRLGMAARGIALGALAGLGAVVLTPVLGLPRRHRGSTLRTQAMTVALYALGGVAAGAMASLLNRPTRARALGARLAQDADVALYSGVEPQTGEW
jgi:hypothetical protein